MGNLGVRTMAQYSTFLTISYIDLLDKYTDKNIQQLNLDYCSHNTRMHDLWTGVVTYYVGGASACVDCPGKFHVLV